MKFFTLLSSLMILFCLDLTAQLQAPESIVWNELTDSYIISDAGAGKLWKMDKSGIITEFTNGLNQPKGITFTSISLWVTDVTKIVEIDPESGVKLNEYPITGARQLNDIVADDFGYIYISDMQTNQIYRFDDILGTSEVFSQGIMLQPNGIYYDLIGGLIVLSYSASNAKIYSVDLEEGNVNELMTTTLGNLDGIAYDSKRDIYYLSSWKSKSVYSIDPSFVDQPVLVQSNLDGPADIYYYEEDDVLAVPVMNEGRIEFISFGSIDLSAPNLIAPANNAEDVNINVTCTWNEVQNAESYVIEFATSSDFNESSIIFLGSTDNNDSHSLDLESGTHYYWHVKAEAGESKSDWSVTRNFSTLVEKPTETNPTDNTTLKKPFEFSWSHSESEGISYNFVLSTDNSFVTVVLDTILANTSLSIDYVNYFTDYYWKVKAIKNQISSQWTDASKFTIILNTPELSIPADKEENLELPIDFGWDIIPDAQKYRLEVSPTNSFDNAILDTIVTTNSLNYNNFEFEKEYFWRVVAMIDNNEAEWSEIFSFKTQSDPNCVEDNIAEFGLQIFPNPMSEKLYIKNNSLSNVNIRIFNLLGVVSHDLEAINSGFTKILNTEHIPNGLYFIEIKIENKTYHQQIVKY